MKNIDSDARRTGGAMSVTAKRIALLAAAVAVMSCARSETPREAADLVDVGIERQRQQEFERAAAEANRFEADVRERARAASGEAL